MPKTDDPSLIAAALEEAAKHQAKLNEKMAELENLPERWKKARLAEMMNKELDQTASGKADETQADPVRFDHPFGYDDEPDDETATTETNKGAPKVAKNPQSQFAPLEMESINDDGSFTTKIAEPKATGRYDAPKDSTMAHYEVTLTFVVPFSHTDPAMWGEYEIGEFVKEITDGTSNWTIESKPLQVVKDGS